MSKKNLILACLFLLAFVHLSAQAQRLPRFDDYPVTEKYIGKPAPAIIKGAKARTFRTRLIEGAKDEPNFAGHYRVILWGCGTGCFMVAIVDAKTGKVHFPPFGSVSVGMAGFTEDNPAFRVDSRLLIVKGSRDEEGGGVYYYVFDRGNFRLVRSMEDKNVLQ